MTQMRFLAAAILLAFPVDSLVGSPFHRVSSRRLAPTRRLPPLRSLVPAPSTVQGTDEFKGKVHELGAACKTAALDCKTKMIFASPLMKPYHLVQVILFYTLFIIYRAYRGFFVIIPAVFLEVQGRLKAGLTEAENELNADIDPSTGTLRTRSSILINIGASFVTLIYSVKTVTGGLFTGLKRLFSRGKAKEEVAEEATPGIMAPPPNSPQQSGGSGI
mmetsp:Transcript_19848/g.45009  ORF Transcript_19848/g.45009 Transcript_19848/m.45009 type:complete len:218 (+) Transcript_19848:62-715(+)